MSLSLGQYEETGQPFCLYHLSPTRTCHGGISRTTKNELKLRSLGTMQPVVMTSPTIPPHVNMVR